jgi:hypothetical protein
MNKILTPIRSYKATENCQNNSPFPSAQAFYSDPIAWSQNNRHNWQLDCRGVFATDFEPFLKKSENTYSNNKFFSFDCV